MNQIQQWRKRTDKILSDRRAILSQIQSEKEALEKAESDLSDGQETQRILQSLAENVQRITHSRISKVVSKCLESVFQEDAYKFKINFVQSRGKTDAQLKFVRDGNELNPLTSSGGGCLDIAAFSLRLACLVLSKPNKRRWIALDEPFKNLSVEYREYVPQLLETLAKEMNLQIVMTTNLPEIACGNVIRLKNE